MNEMGKFAGDSEEKSSYLDSLPLLFVLICGGMADAWELPEVKAWFFQILQGVAIMIAIFTPHMSLSHIAALLSIGLFGYLAVKFALKKQEQ